MALPTLFCLEGDWDEGLTSKRSVRSLLQLIESMGYAGHTIHRDAARRDEFDHYFTQWLGLDAAAYPIAYLASHGSAGGGVALGYSVDEQGHQSWHQRSLRSLERMITPADGAGRVLYFGACEVLDRPGEYLMRFCRTTGIDAVIGYSRQADWLETATVDLLVLSRLLDTQRNGSGFSVGRLQRLFGTLRKDIPRYLSEYGFTIATATWVSPDQAVR